MGCQRGEAEQLAGLHLEAKQPNTIEEIMELGQVHQQQSLSVPLNHIVINSKIIDSHQDIASTRRLTLSHNRSSDHYTDTFGR
jgi:hypothetical protein